MEDLFAREQTVYDKAADHVNEIENGAPCRSEAFIDIVKEYGKLLRQLRRVTKLSDKTTENLNASKLDLIDKVHYDGLTGIYNRRYMEDNMKNIIKKLSRAQGGLISLLMIDIDLFKKYNDTYGHSAGDDCLRSVAEAIRKSILRNEDFAARYGGEEFAVVLPNTDEKGARHMADKLLENVRALNIPHEKSEAAPYVTISVGITTGRVNFTNCSVDYVKRADEALYVSKQTGRNKYTFLNFQNC